MKFLIALILCIVFNTAKAEDYIIQFQAKVKNLKEFSISRSEPGPVFKVKLNGFLTVVLKFAITVLIWVKL